MLAVGFLVLPTSMMNTLNIIEAFLFYNGTSFNIIYQSGTKISVLEFVNIFAYWPEVPVNERGPFVSPTNILIVASDQSHRL